MSTYLKKLGARSAKRAIALRPTEWHVFKFENTLGHKAALLKST